MKSKNISVISAVIITLLLSTLSFAQAKPTPQKAPRMQKMQKMQNMQNMHNKQSMKAMHKKLNLTDKQKANFKKLNFTFAKQMVDLKANLQKSGIDLKKIKSANNIKRGDVINVVKKINRDKNAIALATANHRMDMYEVLTPEQRKIWKKSKMHRMTGRKMMKGKSMMKGKNMMKGKSMMKGKNMMKGKSMMKGNMDKCN